MRYGHLMRPVSFATALLISISVAWALEMNISPELPFLDVEFEGKQVRIQRIQEPEHRLDSSFTKTSRPCPPFCIHPMQAAVGVRTVGELELLNFLIEKVRTGGGLLIDSRLPEWFEEGTIPGAVTIPWTLLAAGPDNPHTAKILLALGALEERGD